MYEALPMHARIAHWEGRAAAQAELLVRLKELAALQQSKLAKTKAAVLAAEEELSTQQRKLSDLAAEQASWGPGTDLAAHDPYGGGDYWDSYVWCYDSMTYVWRDPAPSRPAALHASAAAAAGSDAGLVADRELKDGLLTLLGQVHAHAPNSNAWRLAEEIQRQSARLALKDDGAKSEGGSAAPSPTASQASTVPYSQQPAPFNVRAAAAPAAPAPPAAAPALAAGAATPIVTPAPSLHARAKAAPRAIGRLAPAKRGNRAAPRPRIGVASPARTMPATVDLHKVRLGAAEVVIIDEEENDEEEDAVDGAMDVGDGAAAAAFPQAAEEAATGLA
jgi:hypothetical protein